MPLRDLLKKKDKPEPDPPPPPPPPFTFLRSDTHTQEMISLPDDDEHEPAHSSYDAPAADSSNEGGHRGRLARLAGRSRSRSRSQSTTASNASQRSESAAAAAPPKEHKRLSQRLGLRREESSDAVPRDLPEVEGGRGGGGAAGDGDGDAWEQRATLLARENDKRRRNSSGSSRPGTPAGEEGPDVASVGRRVEGGKRESGIVASRSTDDTIQEAIRLHEAGELEEATRMFGRLADPQGENNALSQVLYALALRHGWGCTADPETAMEYLSAAAANAASIETEALQGGRKGGGAAKGELVLAIFELANSFRHGWGVKKDPIAAKQYYETAANLGDTGTSQQIEDIVVPTGTGTYTAPDAMNEVGWCYLEGFGCKKDKLKSAKYYRLAEAGGNKILGNSWIWKPKYDQPE